jgi:hypothetical protein
VKRLYLFVYLQQKATGRPRFTITTFKRFGSAIDSSHMCCAIIKQQGTTQWIFPINGIIKLSIYKKEVLNVMILILPNRSNALVVWQSILYTKVKKLEEKILPNSKNLLPPRSATRHEFQRKNSPSVIKNWKYG